MAYELPNPLGSKSAGGTFAGYRVDRQGNAVNLTPVDEALNFQQMRGRRTPVDPSYMVGRNNPVYPGVSVFTTMDIGTDTYLALVQQERPSGDTVLKLVSGYMTEMHMQNPLAAVKEELSEEILPWAPDGKVIRIAIGDEITGEPFAGKIQSHGYILQAIQTPVYMPEGLLSPVTVEGNALENNPQIFFWLPENNAQLVYAYHFDGNALRDMGVSLHHSEDRFNPITKMLDAVPHPYGIYLAGLDNNKLTSEIYTMQEGKLVGISHDEFLLSEAFAPIENGFVDRRSIPLQEYRKMHNRWI
ncbi:MAG: hypothetical protein J4431_02630 [Candidatus Aenigmarchaeota archaeon]|nr:hypothetical protein [Candidatus Aenigmarchaeota archaeon]